MSRKRYEQRLEREGPPLEAALLSPEAGLSALCQAMRMLDLNDLTWYAFDNRGFSVL